MENVENGQTVGAEREWDEMHPKEPEEETWEGRNSLARIRTRNITTICISAIEYSRLLIAEQDAQAMAGRLLDEDEDSFSPETFQAMRRWRPRWEKLLRGE